MPYFETQFIDLCILLGCDYCGSIRGIGPMRALQLIKQHRSIETILENIDQKKVSDMHTWAGGQSSCLLFPALRVLVERNYRLCTHHRSAWQYPVEEGWKYKEAREFFKDPEITSAKDIEVCASGKHNPTMPVMFENKRNFSPTAQVGHA